MEKSKTLFDLWDFESNWSEGQWNPNLKYSTTLHFFCPLYIMVIDMMPSVSLGKVIYQSKEGATNVEKCITLYLRDRLAWSDLQHHLNASLPN